MLRIVTLMEDAAPKNGGLVHEHGLSLYIEYNGKRFLFDTGTTNKFLINADRMGVNLDNLDGCIISHNHYDHGGGYLYLARRKYKLPCLYIGENFFDVKYKMGDGGSMTFLASGITPLVLKRFGVEHVECRDWLELCPGAWMVSGFKMENDFEKPVARFTREVQGQIDVDQFKEEASLVFETERGLVFVVGCSHPGIVNMIRKVQAKFDKPIYAVYGGTHLVAADDKRIKKTLDFCEKSGIKVLGMCHCTGKHAEDMIKERSQFQWAHLAPGDVVII